MYSDQIRDFLSRNATIQTRIRNPNIIGEDVWALNLDVEWAELGRLVIRRGVKQDQNALKVFLLDGLDETSRFLFAPYPYEGELDAALEACLAASEGQEILLYHAWLEDRIIGHFFLGGFSEAIPQLGIAIADKYHGQKLGHLFMTLLVGVCATTGKQAIELTTNPQNHAGFHLYKKIGFEHIGDREIVVGNGIHRIEHEMIYRFD